MRKLKQSMAILLGAAMTISLLPSLPATAAEEKMEVVAQYDMSYADGYLTDKMCIRDSRKTGDKIPF